MSDDADEDKASIPAWVMTFADLMSLLMCFFVLLLSFSEIDARRFKQIAGELAVAATTIKTHIRNLYQKLGVAHRQDAVQHAQQLLKMMGYGV